MRKTGEEPIKFRGKDTGLRLRDFWSWGFSDLLDNTLRGSYAEFIVAAKTTVKRCYLLTSNIFISDYYRLCSQHTYIPPSGPKQQIRSLLLCINRLIAS